MNVTVDDVMTKKVICLHPDQTISEAVEELAMHGISGAPVTDDDGSLVGVITEKDIFNALRLRTKRLEMVYPSLSMVSVSFVEKLDDREALDAFREIANSTVKMHMTKDVLTVESGTPLGQAVNLILLKGVNRIPVMDKGNMVGIISRADIIKGLANSKISNPEA